jgi:hypothetical protein
MRKISEVKLIKFLSHSRPRLHWESADEVKLDLSGSFWMAFISTSVEGKKRKYSTRSKV